MSEITIRPMLPTDVTAAMRLKTIVGFNQTEADWQLFLDLHPQGCFVAEAQSRVVGTVTSINYTNVVAWIGMMLVHPDFRRRGIATRLMHRVLDSLSACPSIKLDATPLGKKVYDRMGFRDEFTFYRLIGTCPEAASGPDRVAPLAERDIPAITALDLEAFGADRMSVVRALLRRDARAAWKLEYEGQVRGYCTGRPGIDFYQLGPVVAGTPEEATVLVTACLNQLAGHDIGIDVPEYQGAFTDWLTSIGVERQRPLVRMVHGTDSQPSLPPKLFAVAGPELG